MEKINGNLIQKSKELLEQYLEVCTQNENLRKELIETKAQNELLNNQISDLQEDIRIKNLNEEELLSEIEAVLNK